MDLSLINNIVEQIKADKDRVNEYKGLENIISMLSDEEFRYLLEQSGEDLLLNSTLKDKVFTTRPHQSKDFINYYVDKFTKIVDNNIKQTQYLGEIGGFTANDTNRMISNFSDVKKHLTKFKKKYIGEIDNILKK